jgi:TP901 family phage tail tape measure protein
MATAGSVRAGGAFVEIFAKDGAFQQAMTRVQARLKAVGASMQQFGTKMMLGGTAVGLPLVLAARQAATFEDALLGMRAAAGLSADQVAVMEAEALRLSKTMGVSPAKIANAMLELAKAGMDVKDVLGGAAESAIQFARVSGVEMADAAVFMKVAMNSFGVSAVEAVDTLSAAADASETSIAAMVESFALVGSAGALFNQSLFDISQGLAILARFGIRGEEAGTGIKTMLVRLTSPSNEAREALAKIGLTMGDFRDQAGKLLPIGQIVDILARKLGQVDKMAGDEILTTVFGDRGIRVIGAFLQVGQQGFTSMADAMESNLSVAAKFQIIMSGISGAFDKLGAAVQRLSISFAKSLGDSFGPVVSGITFVLDAIGALIERFPLITKLVVGVVGGMFLLGAAAIVAGLALKVLSAAVGVLSAVLAAIATPIGMMAAILVGGITLAIVAARQLSPAFRREFDAIMEALAALDFSRAWQLMKLNLAIAITQMAKIAHGFFASIGNAAAAAGSYISDKIIEGLDRLMGVFGSDILAMQSAFEKLGLYLRAAFDWKFAITGLRSALAEVDREVEKRRKASGTANDRARARRDARQQAADDRQRQDDERNAQYDATIANLVEERDRAKMPQKPAQREDEKTAAKRSDFRKPGFDSPGTGQAVPGFGAMLATFSSGIAGQIGIGPQVDFAKATADNTKRTADGIQQLLNVGDFGKGGIKNLDPAALQQAIAQVGQPPQAPVAPDDRDLVSASEKTAAASERQVQLLDQIARAVRSGGLAFA